MSLKSKKWSFVKCDRSFGLVDLEYIRRKGQGFVYIMNSVSFLK